MHAEKQWHNCSKKNKTNCVITRRTISDPLLTKWAIWDGQLYLLSDIKKKVKTQFESRTVLILLNWYQDVYIYLRTFCGTEPPLINLRETLSQEPHRLGGSKERSISKIIRDFWLNFTTENANKQFIFCWQSKLFQVCPAKCLVK